MAKHTITYTFADEEETQAVVTTRLFRCLADRLAFERQYGRSYASLLPPNMQSAIGADGELDAKLLTPEQMAALQAVPDEYQAFFTWRALRRSGGPAYKELTFDAFCDGIGEVLIADGTPTEEAAGDSPLAQAVPLTS